MQLYVFNFWGPFNNCSCNVITEFSNLTGYISAFKKGVIAIMCYVQHRSRVVLEWENVPTSAEQPRADCRGDFSEMSLKCHFSPQVCGDVRKKV